MGDVNHKDLAGVNNLHVPMPVINYANKEGSPAQGQHRFCKDTGHLLRCRVNGSWEENHIGGAFTQTIYCDFANGSDSTGDGSNGNPFKTFNHALSRVPKYIPAAETVTIHMKDCLTWDEQVLVQGYDGGGALKLVGSARANVLNSVGSPEYNCFRIHNCTCWVLINEIGMKMERNDNACIHVEYSPLVSVGTCDFCTDGVATNTMGVESRKWSRVFCGGCYDRDANKVAVGITSDGGEISYAVLARFGVVYAALPSTPAQGSVIIPRSLINGGSPRRASAYRASSDQVIPTGTETKIQFDAENFDTESDYAHQTNYRYTAEIPGYYSIPVRATMEANGSGEIFSLILKKNGATVIQENTGHSSAAGDVGLTLPGDLVWLDVDDYVECCIFQNNGGNRNLKYGTRYSCVSIQLTS